MKLPAIRKIIQLDNGYTSDGISHIESLDEPTSPNLRALRLALSVCETLLSMGVPTSSVVSRGLDITDSFCKDPVHIDINSNVITLSQLRSLDREPLTLIRPTATRATNYMTVQAVQDLVHKIDDRSLTLTQAEKELDRILRNQVVYPDWLIPIANASLAAGVVLMFTTNWRMILVTFVIVWLVDHLVAMLSKKKIATFFRQITAGIFVTLGAVLINWLSARGIDFFNDMNPTIIVVGGIIMLLAGLAIVSAIQDAIDEFYVTANARILRVMLLTTGLVIGVLIALYVARKMGVGIAVSPNPLSLTALHFQIIGGAIVGGAFAVASHTRLRAVVWAGLLGALSVLVFFGAINYGISSVPASGIAALVVGVIAKMLSRFWRTPSSGIIAAAIVPLVPGLSLYTGLMQLVNYPPGDPFFMRGVGTLFTAAAIALAIAAGASFGSVVARPLKQRQVFLRNLIPFSNYMHEQLLVPHKKSLARIVFGYALAKNDKK